MSTTTISGGGVIVTDNTQTALRSKSAVDQMRDRIMSRASADGRERRWATVDRAEVRAVNEDGSYDFEGHAAVFDSFSEDLGFPGLGSFHEVIKRGAFKPVLGDDVRFLFNHDPNLVLARSTSGTMDLAEDPKGLLVKANVAPTSYAQDIRILLDRGDISQMSFAFIAAEDEWVEDKDGNVTRTILKFEELFDVSVVTYPAYTETDAQARALRKLDRGETLAAEEQKALMPLLRPYSAELGNEERALQATGQEPKDEDESPATEQLEEWGRFQLSGRQARLRLRAHEAGVPIQ